MGRLKRLNLAMKALGLREANRPVGGGATHFTIVVQGLVVADVSPLANVISWSAVGLARPMS